MSNLYFVIGTDFGQYDDPNLPTGMLYSCRVEHFIVANSYGKAKVKMIGNVNCAYTELKCVCVKKQVNKEVVQLFNKLGAGNDFDNFVIQNIISKTQNEKITRSLNMYDIKNDKYYCNL